MGQRFAKLTFPRFKNLLRTSKNGASFFTTLGRFFFKYLWIEGNSELGVIIDRDSAPGRVIISLEKDGLQPLIVNFLDKRIRSFKVVIGNYDFMKIGVIGEVSGGLVTNRTRPTQN